MRSDRRKFLRSGSLVSGLALSTAAPSASAEAADNETAGVKVFNVLQHGASGEGTTPDTATIQAAIDACAANGGGIVLFPNGRYLSGTLFLRDNVILRFAAEATLLGSKRREDYPGQQTWADQPPARALIYALRAKNIGIEGKGVIDGQGAGWRDPGRPKIIYWEECENASLNEINLKDSAFWVAHFVACDRLRLEGVTLASNVNYNNDGFDIDGCHDVFVSNCKLDCKDDAICLKSGLRRSCERIVVTNCVIRTRWGAIKFGTSSLGGFENITISNCVIHDTQGGAIKLLMVDGGKFDNVNISNIVMDNVTSPLFFRLGSRGRTYGTGPESSISANEKRPVGVFRNVTISNIRAKHATTAQWEETVGPVPVDEEVRIGCYITGIPGHLIENVVLENIQIFFPGGGTREEAQIQVPEDEDRYPEYTFFGQSPAYGFFVRHAKGITLRDIQFDTEQPDMRPALVCDDVQDLEVRGFRARGQAEGEPLVRLVDTRSAVLQDCKAVGGAPALLEVRGKESEDITLFANDLRSSKKGFILGEQAPGGAVRAEGNLMRKKKAES